MSWRGFRQVKAACIAMPAAMAYGIVCGMSSAGGQGDFRSDDGGGHRSPESNVAVGEVAHAAADDSGDGVLAPVGQLVFGLGVGVDPLGQVEAGAELPGRQFLPGAVPVDIRGDQHEQTQSPGVGRAGAVRDADAVPEVAGDQQTAAREQRVTHGVRALEVEKLHRGAAQDHHERRPGCQTGHQGDSGCGTGDQHEPVGAGQEAGPFGAEALFGGVGAERAGGEPPTTNPPDLRKRIHLHVHLPASPRITPHPPR